MPIHYDIDTIDGIIYSIATGDTRGDDLLGHMKSLRADKDFSPSMKELFDMRGARLIEISIEDIRKFVVKDEEDTSKLHSYMLAIVVPTDMEYGMARMYQMMTEKHNPNISVFRDKDEAKAWLGIKRS